MHWMTTWRVSKRHRTSPSIPVYPGHQRFKLGVCWRLSVSRGTGASWRDSKEPNDLHAPETHRAKIKTAHFLSYLLCASSKIRFTFSYRQWRIKMQIIKRNSWHDHVRFAKFIQQRVDATNNTQAVNSAIYSNQSEAL